MTTVYRDAVVRLSIREIRGRFRPKDFDEIECVSVEHGPVAANVKIIWAPSETTHGGRRRWIECPKCGRKTSTVGVVITAEGSGYWACSRCGHWKSRKPSRSVTRLSP